MDLFNIEVRLASDLTFQVAPVDKGFGHGIASWPEIELLRHLHGPDAVVIRSPAGEVDTDVQTEKARLVSHYRRERVEVLFPGQYPQMPMSRPARDTGVVHEPPALAGAAAPLPRRKGVAADL